MKYYIIAGEASGDLHGSNLIRELYKKDSKASVRCWGGDKMESAGATLVKHYRELAFMGFTEVLKNLRTIFRNIAFCKKDILNNLPDVLILIDYPGFNMRIAKWAKKKGIKVIYYISPQIWAWKENRIHAIKRDIDKMLVILPFEKAFYQKWDFEVEYVGHPLVEVVDAFMDQHQPDLFPYKKPIIAILPGSRKQEILMKLPLMLDAVKYFSGHTCIVAKAPGLPSEFYDALLKPYPNVETVEDKTYTLLNHAEAALVTSGTATLETALFGVPEIICYKGGNLSYLIAKRLIKIKYIGLVNLIMDKLVVKELIQHELTTENIREELNALLQNKERQAALKEDYAQLRMLLKQGGRASANAAASITSYLKLHSTQ